ncbi:MAG: hypothetical protein WBI06_06230 [Paludibacter sp.]
MPESEFRHPVSSSVAGNGVPIRDDRTPIREAGVLFGMTEFRLRQYSPIQFIPVAGIGITPFGRDRWFQHPEVAGIGIPASRFHPSCRKWSSNLG